MLKISPVTNGSLTFAVGPKLLEESTVDLKSMQFFKLYDFDKYSLIEDDKENLLYIDRLIETNSIIIGNKQFGIIGIFQNE